MEQIKECLCYNFSSLATKQHAASMLTNQQQKLTETLQEYVQRFSDLLPKSSSLLPHQAKDLVHITYFIRNLHNQKLQLYVLGKNPMSVQNAITWTKNYWRSPQPEADHAIHNISLNQKEKPSKPPGPCHTFNGPLTSLKDCDEAICLRCKPSFNDHSPAKCPS